MQNRGNVIFAGSGAGGLDNLTIGVLREINSAEAILYDALVDKDIIDIFPQKCIKICVGKRAGFHSVPQEKTNQLLVKLALKGLKVLRLKGGDPSIFSRITEEREALNMLDIPHKTMAGVSAAQVAAAQFNFALTTRNNAQSIEFVTASNFLNQCNISKNILTENKTIAFYMGGKKTSEILFACKSASLEMNLPIAIIENAGQKNSKIIYGSLCEINNLIKEFDNGGPILIILGKVVKAQSDYQTLEVLKYQNQ